MKWQIRGEISVDLPDGRGTAKVLRERLPYQTSTSCQLHRQELFHSLRKALTTLLVPFWHLLPTTQPLCLSFDAMSNEGFS